MNSPLCGRPQIQSEIVGHPSNNHAIITLASTSHRVGWCCSMQGPVLDKMTDVFSLPVVFRAPSVTVETIPGGRKLPAPWFPGWLLYVLQLKSVISLAIGFYHPVRNHKVYKNKSWDIQNHKHLFPLNFFFLVRTLNCFLKTELLPFSV